MALQITPPPSAATLPATASVATGTVAPVDVSVAGTPANVDQLLRQITISGTVASAPDNGAVTLATALGNFQFSFAQLPDAMKQQLTQQLENLFQSQKPITAIVQPGAPPTQGALLLPNTSAGTPPQPAVPGTTAPPQNPPPQQLTLSPGTSFPAVILPPDIALSGTAATSNAAQTNLLPNNQAANPPALSNTLPTPATIPQAAVPQNPPAVVPQTLSAVTPALQPGQEVTVTIVAVAPPGAPPLAPTAPNQIAASVVGNGPNGQLIVKTNDTTLYVRTNVEAPISTSVLVTIDAVKSANPTVLPMVDAQNFSSLQQVLDALSQINPQLAQQITNTQIPQPTMPLAGPLLFFLSALKQGDVKNWLGPDGVDALTKSGKLALLSKLGQDMEEATQTARDATVGDWTSYTVPIHNNGQFQPLNFYVHGDTQGKSSEGGESNAPKQVRFLIDFRMSHLGPLQLDGLVRPKKLDMIVRSESPLPPGLPQDLRSGYINTIEALGYSGSLSFQIGKQHWLIPYKDHQKDIREI